MRVLLSFTESRPLWTVAELASELGLTQSAVYRYIGLLREVGLVEPARGNRYALTERTLAMAAAANAARVPLGVIAVPILNRLRDTIDETVFVARRIGWQAFTVARAESRKPVRLQFEYGQGMNLHFGSMARILLSAMPVKERELYLDTLTTAERSSALLTPEALDQLARDRSTESFEEIEDGIWGTAAAIADRDGQVVGSVGCAAPIYRTNADRRRNIREVINSGAADISAALQAHPEPPVANGR